MTRLALLLVPMIGLAPGAAAQDAGLGAVFDSLALMWANSDAVGIAAFAPQEGITLDTGEQAPGRLAGHKAAAALRRLFDMGETVALTSDGASRVDGATDQAFAELDWELMPPGGSASETVTVFFALALEEGVWRLTQIRILP